MKDKTKPNWINFNELLSRHSEIVTFSITCEHSDIPILEIKKANEHNTSGFTFRWLFLTVWIITIFPLVYFNSVSRKNRNLD